MSPMQLLAPLCTAAIAIIGFAAITTTRAGQATCADPVALRASPTRAETPAVAAA